MLPPEMTASCTPPQRMNEIMASHTGREVEEIARDTERDYYMSADEALTYGLVDQVLVRRELASIESVRPGKAGNGVGASRASGS